MTEHAAPRHLSAESKRLWRETTRVYQLEPRHEAILLCALEAFDRMRQAQAAVTRDGPYTEGRFGMKAHPALAVERDSRLAFLRSQRELGLDLEAPVCRYWPDFARAPRWWRPRAVRARRCCSWWRCWPAWASSS